MAIIYCVDTSSFIDLKVYYSRDTFPKVWLRLEGLVSSGRLIAPINVYEELQEKEDEIADWAKGYKEKGYLFVDLTPKQWGIGQKIASKFPDLINPKKTKPDADPFVIALALERQESTEQGLFPKEYIHIVVAQERIGTKKLKIPNVCQQLGIDCINLQELFKKENWKF